MANLDEVAGLIAALETEIKNNQLNYYAPYEYQKKFHGATGKNTTRLAIQRALMAANQLSAGCDSIVTSRRHKSIK